MIDSAEIMSLVYGAVWNPRTWDHILGWCLGSAGMLAQGTMVPLDGYEATVTAIKMRDHLMSLDPDDRLAALELLTYGFCVYCGADLDGPCHCRNDE